MIRAVAFDLDGVLIDSEPIFLEAARRLLAERGREIDQAFMQTMMGQPGRECLPRFVRHFRLDESVPEVEEAYKYHYFAVLGGGPVPLMPGAAELVRAVTDRGLPACIATSSSRPYVMRVFEPHGLIERFTFVLTCDDVTRGKPHPEMYQMAAAKFGVEPGEMLVIEDSENGVTAAKAAGAVCVAVPHARTPREKVAAADRVVTSLVGFDATTWVKG